MTHATRVLQIHNLSEEGINYGSHAYILTTQGHGGPPRMMDQFNAGATSETTQTWETVHTILEPIHSNKANMKGWLWRSSDIRGPCGPKAFWYLFYRWGKKKPKNLTQQTCPDRGSNPGPLRDRRVCYSPVNWTCPALTTAFHSFLFLALAFQFLMPRLLRSLSRSSVHRLLGWPLFFPLSIL